MLDTHTCRCCIILPYRRIFVIFFFYCCFILLFHFFFLYIFAKIFIVYGNKSYNFYRKNSLFPKTTIILWSNREKYMLLVHINVVFVYLVRLAIWCLSVYVCVCVFLFFLFAFISFVVYLLACVLVVIFHRDIYLHEKIQYNFTSHTLLICMLHACTHTYICMYIPIEREYMQHTI